MAKRKQIDWEAIRQEHPALNVLNIENNESGVMHILRSLERAGRFFEALGIPEGKIEFEFPLPKGRADIVVFHYDGTVSVIEAKGFDDMRNTIAGIGQVIMYAVQIGYSRATNGIRKLLIAPMAGKDPVAGMIYDACRHAGVEFIPIGTIEQHQDISFDIISGKYPEYINKSIQ